jgi:hypothetical protein
MFSRVLETRLYYIQHNLRRIARQDAELMGVDYISDQENVFLPSSFVGSTRWTQENISNGLAIAASLGNPTFFITMTCNPRWPEITSRLRPGQTVADIPEVVVRVFKAKLTLLLRVSQFKFIFSMFILNAKCFAATTNHVSQ